MKYDLYLFQIYIETKMQLNHSHCEISKNNKSVLKTVLDLEGRVKVVPKPSWLWGWDKRWSQNITGFQERVKTK